MSQFEMCESSGLNKITISCLSWYVGYQRHVTCHIIQFYLFKSKLHLVCSCQIKEQAFPLPYVI